MTAYSMREDRDRFIIQGLDDYIAKPIRAIELINKVRQWIRDEKITTILPSDPEKQEIINMEVYNQLIKLGGQDMVKSVIGDFINESEEQLRICAESLKNGNYDEIKKQLHTLKGSSGTLGIERIASIAADIEAKLKNQLYENIEEELNFLNFEIAEFITFYNGLLK